LRKRCARSARWWARSGILRTTATATTGPTALSSTASPKVDPMRHRDTRRQSILRAC